MKNMDSKKIFIDVNILMEILFERKKFQESKNLVQINRNKFISCLAIHLCNYFLEKDKRNVSEYQEFFDDFNLVTFDNEIVEKAYQIYNKDFEDAIQIASFLESDCDEFWTLDQKLKDNYGKIAKIRVL